MTIRGYKYGLYDEWKLCSSLSTFKTTKSKYMVHIIKGFQCYDCYCSLKSLRNEQGHYFTLPLTHTQVEEPADPLKDHPPLSVFTKKYQLLGSSAPRLSHL